VKPSIWMALAVGKPLDEPTQAKTLTATMARNAPTAVRRLLIQALWSRAVDPDNRSGMTTNARNACGNIA
jgi:hypothetical protein